MRWKWIPILLSSLCLFCASTLPSAYAEGEKEDTTGSNALYEAGFHLGNLLPNQIAGVTEITSLGGVRGGFRFAPMTYAESGLIMGNGGGVEWKNLHVDARVDIPVENLVGLVYGGADMVYYKGLNMGTRMIFGGHVGGGIQTLLSGSLWFRADMKFGFSPGTSLYVGAGLVLRYGG